MRVFTIFTRKTFSFIFLGALLLALLTLWIDTQRSPDQPSGMATASYTAFASKASSGGTRMSALLGGDALVGGLTSDKLKLANGQSFPVQQTGGLAAFAISLPHNALLQASGKLVNRSTYRGSFTLTHSGDSLSMGDWVAVEVRNSQTVISYEFLSDSAGADYSGAMVMGTTSGTLYLPDGTVIPVVSKRPGPSNSLSGPVTLSLQLPNGEVIVCIGTPLKNSPMQGISGLFVDPVTHHSRVCNALVFSY